MAQQNNIETIKATLRSHGVTRVWCQSVRSRNWDACFGDGHFCYTLMFGKKFFDRFRDYQNSPWVLFVESRTPQGGSPARALLVHVQDKSVIKDAGAPRQHGGIRDEISWKRNVVLRQGDEYRLRTDERWYSFPEFVARKLDDAWGCCALEFRGDIVVPVSTHVRNLRDLMADLGFGHGLPHQGRSVPVPRDV